MSFASGFRSGLVDRQQAVENARRAELDRRALELHNLQLAQLQRQQTRDIEYDKAAELYTNPAAGLPVIGPVQGQAAQAAIMDPEAAGLAPQTAPMTWNAGFGAQNVDPEYDRRRVQMEAMRRMGAAGRDPKLMEAAHAGEQQAKVEASIRQAKKMATDPVFQQQALKLLNTRHERVEIYRQKDAKGKETGPYRIRVQDDEGKAQEHKLSDGQFMQLMESIARAGAGDDAGARALIADVEKQIGGQIDTQNKNKIAVAHQDEIGRSNAERERIAAMEAQSNAAYRAGMLRRADRQNPELSADVKKQLDAALVRYYEAKDPRDRARARADYEMILSRAAVDLGKPGRIGGEPKEPIPFKDWIAAMNPNAPTPFKGPGGSPLAFRELDVNQIRQLYDEFNRGQDDVGGAPDFPAAPRNDNYSNEGRNRGLPTAPAAVQPPAAFPAQAPSDGATGAPYSVLDWIREGRPTLSRPLLDFSGR